VRKKTDLSAIRTLPPLDAGGCCQRPVEQCPLVAGLREFLDKLDREQQHQHTTKPRRKREYL
jgi:hypothetical protein